MIKINSRENKDSPSSDSQCDPCIASKGPGEIPKGISSGSEKDIGPTHSRVEPQILTPKPTHVIIEQRTLFPRSNEFHILDNLLNNLPIGEDDLPVDLPIITEELPLVPYVRNEFELVLWFDHEYMPLEDHLEPRYVGCRLNGYYYLLLLLVKWLHYVTDDRSNYNDNNVENNLEIGHDLAQEDIILEDHVEPRHHLSQQDITLEDHLEPRHDLSHYSSRLDLSNWKDSEPQEDIPLEYLSIDKRRHRHFKINGDIINDCTDYAEYKRSLGSSDNTVILRVPIHFAPDGQIHNDCTVYAQYLEWIDPSNWDSESDESRVRREDEEYAKMQEADMKMREAEMEEIEENKERPDKSLTKMRIFDNYQHELRHDGASANYPIAHEISELSLISEKSEKSESDEVSADIDRQLETESIKNDESEKGSSLFLDDDEPFFIINGRKGSR